MKEVNADLYDFLENNETGLFRQKNMVIAYVHIQFCDLNNFIKIVDAGWFDEGGLDVKLFRDTVCIEINDIIEGYGHNLSSYKNCFNESDWEFCEDDILKMEEE